MDSDKDKSPDLILDENPILGQGSSTENIISNNSYVPWTSEKKHIFNLNNNEVTKVLSAAFPNIDLDISETGTLKNILTTNYNIFSKTGLAVYDVVSLNNHSINTMFKATQEASNNHNTNITYHGTNIENAKKIIIRGYNPKYIKREMIGSGIYSSPDIKHALKYSPHQINKKDIESCCSLRIILVNNCIDGKKGLGSKGQKDFGDNEILTDKSQIYYCVRDHYMLCPTYAIIFKCYLNHEFTEMQKEYMNPVPFEQITWLLHNRIENAKISNKKLNTITTDNVIEELKAAGYTCHIAANIIIPGPYINPNTGTGAGPGHGPGLGRGFIPGHGPGLGRGIIPGTNPSPGPGHGPGLGRGFIPGHGPGPGPSSGIGRGIIPGTNHGPGPGPGSGPSHGPSHGPGSGHGHGPSLGRGFIPGHGPGIGPGLGRGRDIIPGTSSGSSSSSSSSSGPSSSSGLGGSSSSGPSSSPSSSSGPGRSSSSGQVQSSSSGPGPGPGPGPSSGSGSLVPETKDKIVIEEMNVWKDIKINSEIEILNTCKQYIKCVNHIGIVKKIFKKQFYINRKINTYRLYFFVEMKDENIKQEIINMNNFLENKDSVGKRRNIHHFSLSEYEREWYNDHNFRYPFFKDINIVQEKSWIVIHNGPLKFKLIESSQVSMSSNIIPQALQNIAPTNIVSQALQNIAPTNIVSQAPLVSQNIPPTNIVPQAPTNIVPSPAQALSALQVPLVNLVPHVSRISTSTSTSASKSDTIVIEDNDKTIIIIDDDDKDISASASKKQKLN
jgi:hypothetical protein